MSKYEDGWLLRQLNIARKNIQEGPKWLKDAAGWNGEDKRMFVLNKEKDMINTEEQVFNVDIRLFHGRFSWKWSKFTQNRYVVAKILRLTRRNLGYDENSQFPEVQFENLTRSRYNSYDEEIGVVGTGEWYLDTALFETVHRIDSPTANRRLAAAFQKACQTVAEEEGISFNFNIMDVTQIGDN